ncbi:MAG: protein kinase domain-containing protein [Myxococcota bacterium]
MATPATIVGGAGGSTSTWEPGTTVGRYTLLTTLAQGGMAEIWLARQQGARGFEKLVVIKRMMNGLESDPESVEMFLSEARLAAQLTHPNVVQIFELGEQADSLYIAMEYLDGEDLSVVRRTGLKHGLPLFDHYAAKLVAMAAEGLHYAHTRVGHDGRPLHIVHRDVSPQNLIATFDGSLKVVDFGIAKVATQHTNSGKLKGKLAYMSPEQARGESLDARSDVFSLGIVLFELITRTRLHPKMGDLELLTKMAGNDPLPRPSERRPDIAPELEAIILKAMERRVEQRYQSARELQEALDGWLRETGKSVSMTELSEYLRTLFARRIHERRQLIEAAMTAELTPSSARHLHDLANREGSSSTSRARTSSTAKGASRGLTAALVVLALVVVGLGVAIGWRMTHHPAEPTPVVAAAPVVVAPPPPPSPAVLVVDTVPGGAELSVDGEVKGHAPLTLEGLTAGVHRLEARLEGYQTAEREVTASAGERVRLEVALLAVPPPTLVAAAEPVPVKTAAPAKRREAQGKLTLKTTPWTTVFLGKRRLGDTPLINQSLPAGRHTLRLVSPETNVESSIEVEILPNETTTKKLKL